MRDRWAVGLLALGLVAYCVAALIVGVEPRLPGVLLAVLAAGSVTFAVIRAARHGRLVSRLHQRSAPTRVAGVLVHAGEVGGPAFVAGLRHPTIFCDRDLPAQLSAGELRAVMLHERAHQETRDPARLLLLGLVSPLLHLLPSGRQWLAVRLAEREIAADRYALANGATRADLASALLRLPPLTRAHVAGFTPAIDLRLRALLGEETTVGTPVALRRCAILAIGGVVGSALCTWFLHRALEMTLGVVCC